MPYVLQQNYLTSLYNIQQVNIIIWQHDFM